MTLVLLTLAAGCVDGVSFLGLGQVLTAAMTGNTVLLGLALGQADVQAAHRSAVALLGFFAGVMLGASIVGRSAAGSTWSFAMAPALAVELVALVAVALALQLAEGAARWTEIRLLLIAATGLAMGIQSAIAHRIGAAGITTTYVTGTLTTLAARLVGGFHRRAPGADRAGQASPSWLPASVWLAYGAGATFAGATRLLWPAMASSSTLTAMVGDVRWPSAALSLPIVIVATIALSAAPGQRHAAAR